jgi:uncharacterized coiled-coil protein SlyX
MEHLAKTIFEFKIVQLEGRLALYEVLITEIAKLESMEKAVSDVKAKLEEVAEAWDNRSLGAKNDGE